ncbi:MacoB NPV orf66-like protein [Peridroma alphabaculovirus]|uniref:MacoB NPV orf66-like protein n=1 Tax=Peridroma alphabaculovirus TaxID=1346829 RepID=A0A068LKD4_9ABAC|nr:MacoB NPV orf66-like protein [Peridroma alphabaculovirus]AIE47829.1 MacoB NPV orf66-like protein [Peridroma alphabaculovirus]
MINANVESREEDQCQLVELSRLYCCYNVRCALIDGVSYCLKCASLHPADAVVAADIKVGHSTLNEIAAEELNHAWTNCARCGGAVVVITDVGACDDCTTALSALYHYVVADGTVELLP